MSSNLPWLDAIDCAERIRSREISAVEVAELLLRRIERLNPRLNAIVCLSSRVIHDAERADTAERRGTKLGPLHGVPFTVKDALDVAGYPATRGSRLFADHVAKADATAVTRLKRAGGIFLGKTNLPEFALWWETENALFGRTVNPWDETRIAGGSSGGEAAALAAGLSYLGLGSDVAGSLRMPAHFCGVVGLKPTHGRVPLTGHWPAFALRAAHVGPMGRSVRDVALALRLISGPDGVDPYALPLPRPRSLAVREDLVGMRVGVLPSGGAEPLEAEVIASVDFAALLMERAGAQVEQAELPALTDNDWQVLSMWLIGAEGQQYLQPVVHGHEEELTPSLRERFESARYELKDYFLALRESERLRSELMQLFARFDVLLCPCAPVSAFPHGRQELDIGGCVVPARHVLRAAVPWNFAPCTALALPCRFSKEGLPLGIQLIAPAFDEGRLLQIGSVLEVVAGVHQRHPTL